MNMQLEDWQQFDRILCIRPDNIGDVLMTTPAIRALKDARPGRHITLLTSSAGAAVAKNIPEVDDIIVFDPPWYRHDNAADRADIDVLVQRLSGMGFDGAVIFTVFSQNPLPTATLCYLAGIPRVAGYCRENPYALMTDWLPDTEPLTGVRHEVQRQLDLATSLGAVPADSSLSLRVPHQRREVLLRTLAERGVDLAEPWIVMHPGASESRRRYPPEAFAAAARELHEQLGVQVVVTGDNRERELAVEVAAAAGAGAIPIAGELDLDDYVALINEAPLLISNNTGPVHIAAAVRTPVVVLYATTNPQHTPWRVPHRVLAFDIPESEVSRNVMVRHARQRFFTRAAGPVRPADIVAAASELMTAELFRRAEKVPHLPLPGSQGIPGTVARPG